MKKYITSPLNDYNLYQRNVYKYCENYVLKRIHNRILKKIIVSIWVKLNYYFLHRVYLNYVEVPITTACTLRCKECANLIQFYCMPYQIDYKDIIKDIQRLCEITDGIGMLRILGGEPLIHKDLDKILHYVKKETRIIQAQIVTNGTLLFDKDILKILRHSKISVDISDYGEKSKKIHLLKKQLRDNHITYYSASNLVWTKQSDFSKKNRMRHDLVEILTLCKQDCISVLNGRLHLCPRSSHGDDLKIFNAKKDEYLDLRRKEKSVVSRKRLYKVLNQKYLTACDYCDIFRQNSLERCVPGEQIRIVDAKELFAKRKGIEHVYNSNNSNF